MIDHLVAPAEREEQERRHEDEPVARLQGRADRPGEEQERHHDAAGGRVIEGLPDGDRHRRQVSPGHLLLETEVLPEVDERHRDIGERGAKKPARTRPSGAWLFRWLPRRRPRRSRSRPGPPATQGCARSPRGPSRPALLQVAAQREQQGGEVLDLRPVERALGGEDHPAAGVHQHHAAAAARQPPALAHHAFQSSQMVALSFTCRLRMSASTKRFAGQKS